MLRISHAGKHVVKGLLNVSLLIALLIPYLDEYAQNLETSIVSCASHCIPSRSFSNTHRIPSWKDGVHLLKRAANFGTKFGRKLVILPLVFFFNLKKTLKVVLSMVYVILSADIIIWCGQKLLVPFLDVIIFGLSFVL